MHNPGMAFFGAEVLKESPLDLVRDILLQTIDKVSSTNPPDETPDDEFPMILTRGSIVY